MADTLAAPPTDAAASPPGPAPWGAPGRRLDWVRWLCLAFAVGAWAPFALTLWRVVTESPVPPAVADPWEHWQSTVYPWAEARALALTLGAGALYAFFGAVRFTHPLGTPAGSFVNVLRHAAPILVLVPFVALTFSVEASDALGARVDGLTTLTVNASFGPFWSGPVMKTEQLDTGDLPSPAGQVTCTAGSCAALLAQSFLTRWVLATLGTSDLAAVPPSLTTNQNSVWCWSSAHCILIEPARGPVADGGAVGTVNGGRTWTIANASLGYEPFTADQPISCGAPSWCVLLSKSVTFASSGVLFATDDGGFTWNSRRIPAGAGVPMAVSCSDIDHCGVLLVGRNGVEHTKHLLHDLVALTDDGGATWRYSSLPVALPAIQPAALSCPSPTWCAVVGEPPAMYVTTDAGSSWTTHRLPADLAPTSGYFGSFSDYDLDCVAARQCILGGDRVGRPGTATSVRVGFPTLLTPRPHSPWIEVTTDSGSTWTPSAVPADAATLGSLDCAGDRCEATIGAATPADRVPADLAGKPLLQVGTILSSSDGGVRWTLHRPPSLGRVAPYPITGP
jgi:hypothetical protein